MRLAAKLVLVFLVAVIALTSATSYLSVRRIYQQHEELAQQVASQIQDALVEAWQRDRDRGVEQLVNSVDDKIMLVEIRWVRFDVAANDPRHPEAPSSMLRGVMQARITTVQLRGSNGRSHLHTYVPVKLEGDPLGGLEISESTERLDRQVRETILTTLGSIGAMALLSAVFIILVGVRMVGRPLDKLIEKTQRVGRGDFSTPIELGGHDELSQLGRSLNEMCEQLAHQQDRLLAESASRVATLQQLRHADRLKTVGRLAAGIAHELGTPLNVVSGRAALMAGGKLKPEEMHASAKTIKAEADRITAIIRQLLDFARRSTPQRTTVKIADVAQRTVDLLRTLSEKRRVALRLDTDDPSLTARVDSNQLQQVLTNLLVNAIQSMPHGGEVVLSIARRYAYPPEDVEAKPGDYICIDVADQGIGITAEDLEHIFEPFFTTKDVGEGTGLGLSIAYGIVQEHGGWIDVASQPGHGSRFSVYLKEETADGARKTQDGNESAPT